VHTVRVCPPNAGGIDLNNNRNAVIATRDSWLNAEPKGESDGTNVVVARTASGAEVLAECERLGYLTVHDESETILDDTQPHQVRLRRTFSSRVAGAIVAGTPTPNFTGLAEDASASALEPAELASVLQGTVDRVRAGQAVESAVMDDWEAIRATL
jgi:hypothetical protein